MPTRWYYERALIIKQERTARRAVLASQRCKGRHATESRELSPAGRVGRRRSVKVIVSAQSDSLDCLVDPRFGRAARLIEFDSESGRWSAHDNPFHDAAAAGGGAGLAHTVVELGAQALITGNLGRRAFTTLTAGGVRIYLIEVSSVEDALRRLLAGELTAAGAETILGPWS